MKLTVLEKRIRNWALEHKEVLFFAVLTLMSVYVRYKQKDFASNDFNQTLLPWYEELKKNGFPALSAQIGDYPIPYQELILLYTMIPVPPLYMYKIAYFLTDLFMSFTGGKIIETITGKKSMFLVTSAILIALPEMVLNSSFWSQSDSLWGGFSLLAVLLLINKKYFWSFVSLGVAFSFKMQTVFLFPFFVMYYLREESFSIFNFLIIPVVFFILCIPAFIAGRPVTSLFAVYFMQVYEYHEMVITFPSFWSLTHIIPFKVYYRFGVLVTFSILGIMLYYILVKKIDLKEPKTMLFTAIITTWTCVYFLPSMHERYIFLTDIMLVLLIILDRDYLIFGLIPLIISIASYASFLTAAPRSLELWAYMELIGYLGMIWTARRHYLQKTGIGQSEMTVCNGSTK